MPRNFKLCPHCGEMFLRQHHSRWQWRWCRDSQSMQRQYCQDRKWSPTLTQRRYDHHVEECLTAKVLREYGSENPLRQRPWQTNLHDSRTTVRND